MKLISVITLLCLCLLNNAMGATIPTTTEDEGFTTDMTTLAAVEDLVIENTEATKVSEPIEPPITQTLVDLAAEEVVETTTQDEILDTTTDQPIVEVQIANVTTLLFKPFTQTPVEVAAGEVVETTTQDEVQYTTTDQPIEQVLNMNVTPPQFTTDQTMLIEKIASNLNAQNYRPIEEYVELDSPSFTSLIPPIIKTAYHNARTNVSNILWLTDNLKSAQHKVLVFENLWSEMQGNADHTQTITLACYLHLQMCECNTDDIDAFNRFEHLKDRLPSIVQKMFWNKVCLRNLQYKEYLYTDEEQFDTDRRVAFTWKPKPKYLHVIDQNHWNIIENQRCQSFLLSNAENEYLYAASDGFITGNQKRRVFTWVPKMVVKQGGWQIEPVMSDGPLVFRLRNLHHNEFLFADKSYEVFDSKRRSVYVGRQTFAGDQDKWEIGDC